MNKVYCLRTVNANYQSYEGFQWPKEGLVSAPDWNSNAECGNGIHGLLKGEGNGGLLSSATGAIWQVVEVDADTIINLSDKVKFPSCNVIFAGSKTEALALIKQKHPEAIVVFSSVAVGDRQVAAVGYGGNATAGNDGTATAGDYGTATAGDGGTATAGDGGTATAGDCGTATAGNYGTAMAGSYGTATAGYRGTAMAGDCGTATAGNYGCISIKYWDGTRYRIVSGNIGEDGLEPNVKYKLDSDHKFVKA